MHFNFESHIKLIPKVLLILIYLTNVLIEVFGAESAANSGHKIESSHSNQIKSFDDSIYFKINWLGDNPDSDPEIDRHIRRFEEQLDEKSIEPKVENVCQNVINSDVMINLNAIQDVVQDDNTLYITTASNEKYICTLPQIDSVVSQTIFS